MYFLSDLVWPNSIRFLDCYMNGKEDLWTCISFIWPRVVPSPAALEVWKRFMCAITTGDQFLFVIYHIRDANRVTAQLVAPSIVAELY